MSHFRLQNYNKKMTYTIVYVTFLLFYNVIWFGYLFAAFLSFGIFIILVILFLVFFLFHFLLTFVLFVN